MPVSVPGTGIPSWCQAPESGAWHHALHRESRSVDSAAGRHPREKGCTVAPATFGLFDHIEDIPGTPTHRCSRIGSISSRWPTREALPATTWPSTTAPISAWLRTRRWCRRRVAGDEEHQAGTDGEAAPAAPSGRDHRRPLRGRPADRRALRLRGRPRRRADRALLVRRASGRTHRIASPTSSGSSADALATGEISSENSAYYDFPTMPLPMKPIQEPIPFWYPGRPVTAGRHGMNLIWPGVIDQETYDLYAETWHKHKGDTIRVDGTNSEPRVGCVMVLAISENERRGTRHRTSRHGGPPSAHARSCTIRPSRALAGGVRHGARPASPHPEPLRGRPSRPARALPTRSRSALPPSSRPG